MSFIGNEFEPSYGSVPVDSEERVILNSISSKFGTEEPELFSMIENYLKINCKENKNCNNFMN